MSTNLISWIVIIIVFAIVWIRAYLGNKTKMNFKEFIGKQLNNLNLQLRFIHPKESIKFSKDYFKGKRIKAAEIGVLKGECSESILKTLNIDRIYLIDPYEKYKDYSNDGSYKILDESKEEAHKRLSKFKNIKWIYEYSNEAHKKINEKLDFIYIDGNHNYNFVKEDIGIYWNKLNEGGMLAGHDIDAKGVSKALIEFIKKENIKPSRVFFGNKTDWWVIK